MLGSLQDISDQLHLEERAVRHLTAGQKCLPTVDFLAMLVLVAWNDESLGGEDLLRLIGL